MGRIKYKKLETKANTKEKKAKKGFLTKEEELALGQDIYKYKTTGDEQYLPAAKEAVEKLYNANKRYAFKMASDFWFITGKPDYYPLEEAQQDASYGLLLALWRFNPNKNTRVTTISYFSIYKELSYKCFEARHVPMKDHGFFLGNYNKAKKSYEELDNPQMSLDEYILENNYLKKKDLLAIKNAIMPVTSLDFKVGEDGHETSIGDLIEDKNYKNPIDNEIFSEELTDLISELDEDEQEVLYINFHDNITDTLEDYLERNNIKKRSYTMKLNKTLGKLRDLANQKNLTMTDLLVK